MHVNKQNRQSKKLEKISRRHSDDWRTYCYSKATYSEDGAVDLNEIASLVDYADHLNAVDRLDYSVGHYQRVTFQTELQSPFSGLIWRNRVTTRPCTLIDQKNSSAHAPSFPTRVSRALFIGDSGYTGESGARNNLVTEIIEKIGSPRFFIICDEYMTWGIGQRDVEYRYIMSKKFIIGAYKKRDWQ
jgi:hypothetical protein